MDRERKTRIKGCLLLSTEALRYKPRCHWITQFYLPPTSLFTIGMNMPAFAFPAEANPHLPIPEGWEAELA